MSEWTIDRYKQELEEAKETIAYLRRRDLPTLDEAAVMAGARLEAGSELAEDILKLRDKARRDEVAQNMVATSITIPMTRVNQWIMVAEGICGYDRLKKGQKP